MKAYRDERGVFHRTQADAKTAGLPFEPVDIPTSHAELIDFVNSLLAPKPTTMEEFISQHAVIVRAPEGDPELRAAYRSVPNSIEVSYRNGDPTTPFLKSRDPAAIFTCRSCGANNRNP